MPAGFSRGAPTWPIKFGSGGSRERLNLAGTLAARSPCGGWAGRVWLRPFVTPLSHHRERRPSGRTPVLTLLHSETYEPAGTAVRRRVLRRDGAHSDSYLSVEGVPEEWSDDARHDAGWLRATVPPIAETTRGTVRVVDVFAGCGGLTLGVAEACRALGLLFKPELAIDTDADALRIYGLNFPTAELMDHAVEHVVAPPGTRGLMPSEVELRRRFGEVDLLIGGPPCQGHSDLNNHTRWADPKNELYLSMARFCEVLRPKHVVIENVPGVVKDGSRVAQRTWARLEALGYSVSSGVLNANELGTGQLRRRSVTIASREMTPSVEDAGSEASVAPRDLRWAIGDLGVQASNAPFDTPPAPNAQNRDRIDFLFERGLYDLPDSNRPDCHKLKSHTYKSMYGRLYWDRPSPTVTTGFGSMGRGRFVHPGERRLLTPHEAARIQGFPDFFRFGAANRTQLHKVIGNAVPPKLGYAVGLHLLR